MSVANCPSCGGPVEFAIGSSVVVICSYCRSVVARTDRGIESHGKVAALIDTGSPLRTGLAGKYRGNGFRITGRSQMRHQAGGAWDEWYAAFDDGRWGWVAEAQGRFYVTFRTGDDAPPHDSISLGQVLDGLTVAEIGRAELISAEGELPWRPEPGYSYSYADLTGTEQRFATIDYSEEPPVVFKGHEVGLKDLGLETLEYRGSKVAATALNCSKCGGPLNLVAPDQTERIWCPNCGAGHDVAAGKLQYFSTLKKKKIAPVIPLGSRGTVDGDEYVVAGFMERAVTFDRDYFWTEYLLYNRERGYRWLVNSDDHWSFVTPLRPGEVGESFLLGGGVGKSVTYDGRSFRLFQDATARVTYVVGEFYWKVAVGEAVDTADYIAPPFGISKEVTRTGAQEISYSHARYMTPKEVEAAFGVDDLPRPQGIGPMQPFPGPSIGGPFTMLLMLLLITAVVIGMARPRRTLLDKTYDIAQLPATAEPGRMFFTDPIEVSGRSNVVIEGFAPVSNEWLYVEGDFVNTLTNRFSDFSMPIEYYHGVDQGERWSEGKKTRRVYLSRPEKGSYVLRLGAQWQDGKEPQSFRLRVYEGGFRWPHFILALLMLTGPAMAALFYKFSFEASRWKDSAHSPYGEITSGDEDEDEE